MNKYFLSIALVVGMAGCTEVKKGVVDTLSPVIASSLECENQDAIKNDLSRWLKLEQESLRASSIGGEICKALVGVTIDILKVNAIPNAWGCRADSLPEDLKGLLSKACDKIP